jgi:hypothetical protein
MPIVGIHAKSGTCFVASPPSLDIQLAKSDPPIVGEPKVARGLFEFVGDDEDDIDWD